MRQAGFTRASTLGPIAELVTSAGGSIERVFQRADLPLGLLSEPDILVPLREHFSLLQIASREVGDELFAARLGRQVSIKGLGVYGKWIVQAPTLHQAISRANASLASMMQSATSLVLRAKGSRACWSYELADPSTYGRQQNELLALGYMIEILRQFLGKRWVPDLIVIGGVPMHGKGQLEQLLATDVLFSETASAVVFKWDLLATRNPDRNRLHAELSLEEIARAFGVPKPGNVVETVYALITLELTERYPSLAWASRKAGMTVRTLQRQLQSEDVRFSELVQAALQGRAFALLRQTNRSITEIAGLLGYNDAAHFTRAFTRWVGVSPKTWRESIACDYGI